MSHVPNSSRTATIAPAGERDPRVAYTDEVRFHPDDLLPAQPALPYNPTRAERIAEWKSRIGPLIAVAIVVIAMVGVIWSQFRKTSPATVQTPTTAEVSSGRDWGWTEHVGRLVSEGDYTAAETLLTARALLLQQENAGRPTVAASDRAESEALELALRRVRSLKAGVNSRAAEVEAKDLLQRGAPTAAAKKYRDALAMRAEANLLAVDARDKDLLGETRLRNAAAEFDVAPLLKTISEARAKAAEASAAGNREDAVRALRLARAKLDQLNTQFRDTSHADPATLLLVDGEIETLESEPRAQQVRAALELGEASAVTDRTASITAFNRALGLQQELLKDFPKSRHATQLRPADIAVARDSALSSGAKTELEELDRQLAHALWAKSFAEADRTLVAIKTLVDRTLREFPQTRHFSDDATRRFEYLAATRPDWEEARTLVDAATRSSAANRDTLAAPVTQALYRQVMLHNPSRSRLPTRPVTEVAAADAVEFCRRLGWLLGKPVRLPSVGEVRAAPFVFNDTAFQEWVAPTGSGFETVSLAFNDAAGFRVTSPLKGFRGDKVGFRFVVAN